MQPSVSISALRQKLQTKIDSFRNKRNIGSVEEAGDGDADMNAAGGNSQDGDGDSDTDNETLASRDDMLEARRKRRGEVRDNRRRKRKAERRLAKEQPVKPSIKASTGSAADGKAVDFKSKTAKASSTSYFISTRRFFRFSYHDYPRLPDRLLSWSSLKRTNQLRTSTLSNPTSLSHPCPFLPPLPPNLILT